MITTYQSTLLAKKELAPHITYFQFSKPTDVALDYKAGQYMIFHIPQDATHAARRLYSIASSPSQKDGLEFIIEYVENGIASAYLQNLTVNNQMTMQGPAGVFFHRESDRSPIFLATGTGIAPLYAIIYSLLEKNYLKNICLFWGLKLYTDLYYFDKLKELATKYTNFQFKICFSREENIASFIQNENLEYCMAGRVNPGFEELLKTINSTPELYDYYLCGSKHVVEGLREYLAAKHVPKEQVYFEKFT